MRRLVAVGISCLVLSLADARAQESGGRPYTIIVQIEPTHVSAEGELAAVTGRHMMKVTFENASFEATQFTERVRGLALYADGATVEFFGRDSDVLNAYAASATAPPVFFFGLGNDGRPYYAQIFASGDHDVVSMLIRSPEEIDPAVYVFATGLRAANRDGAGLPEVGGRYEQGNAEMDVGTLFDDDLISTGRTELILPGAR